MELTVFLKMLNDAAVFLTIAGFAVHLATPVSALTMAILFPALAAGAAYLLDQKGRNRYLALLLSLPALLFAKTAGDWVLLAILLGYLFRIVRRRIFLNDSGDFKDAFSKALFLSLLPCLFSALTFDFDILNGLLLPCVLITAVSGVALLRILRHSRNVIESGAFKLSNCISVALVCLLTLVLSSDVFVNAVAGALGWVYNTLVVDILTGCIYVAVRFLSLFSKLFAMIFNKEVVFYEDGEKGSVGGYEEILYEEIEGQVPPYVTWICCALLAAGFLFLLWKGLRALSGRNRRFEHTSPFALSRETIEVPNEPPRNPFARRSERESIRHQYRKFLRECLNRGFMITPDFDSRQISAGAADYFPQAPLEAFRQLYIRARYTDREISKEDARRAKSLFGEIKKAPEIKTSKTDV
ncbi:MAG: DUF4129 domain-containing protein [Butyricicoccaceae bacterium]